MTQNAMREAIRLSLDNVRQGGGPFGAVVVKGTQIVGAGANQVTATNDPTAHAEVVAIRDACRNLNTFDLTACELYTSCEPCPMCMGAVYWSHIAQVYYGNTREDAAQAGFDDAFIYDQLGLPLAARSIPMHPALRDEALEAFRAWTQVPGRISY